MIKGFTLIEVLIVMAIIGVLSTLAINGYLDYRRSAILDLSAENIVSQINQLKSRAVYGDIGTRKFAEILKRVETGETPEELLSGNYQCFGFYFTPVSEGNYLIKGFSQAFTNKKYYDSVQKRWNYSGCNDFGERNDFDFVLEKDVFIGFSEGQSVNDFVVRFSPPNGEAQISTDGGLSFGITDFIFLIKYSEGEERKIFFAGLPAKLSIIKE